MSGIYMSQNFRSEVARARLIAAVGVEKARWLAPVDPPRDFASALDADDLTGIDDRILAGYEAATKPLVVHSRRRRESNNWVVAGGRSASGKPLLASDPHRAIALPSLRYLVHLNAPGWNVIGSGEPGLPGVAIGHNERIAWGFTIVGTDQADLYVEETEPAGPRRVPGRRPLGADDGRPRDDRREGRGGPAGRAALHAARPGPVPGREDGTAPTP